MDFIEEEMAGSLIILRELFRSGPALAIGGDGSDCTNSRDVMDD
jgi:hypothetical protein